MIVGHIGGGNSIGYQLQRSLRLRASASAYLSRTFGTPTVLGVGTFSCWHKRGILGATQVVFGAGGGTASEFGFNTSNQFYIQHNGAVQATSTAVFRDPSAHYHIHITFNGSTLTEVKINNVTVVTWNNSPNFLNTSGQVHSIGARATPTNYSDGLFSDVHFIDGQALTPSSFGQFDSNGMWQAKPYAGTYGTNGFRLDFSDPTSTTTLMLDRSGNGNNWTANNISLTAGATYDSMLDVPLGGGGGERGNYATWNPLNNNSNVSVPTDGNLKGFVETGAAFVRGNLSTQTVDASGNWWAEFTLGSLVSAAWLGIAPSALSIANVGLDIQAQTGALSYRDSGQKVNAGAQSAYGTSYTSNDVLGIHLNAGVLTFYKQTAGAGAFVSQGSAYTGLSGQYYFFGAGYGSPSTFWTANFGQRPFNNTSLPTGAKAIHTGNLPAPAIANPKLHFDAALYLGNGGTRTVTGLAFQPEFSWLKHRSLGARNHLLFDLIRGVTKYLSSSQTIAEQTNPGTLTAFTSDGFTVGSDAEANENGQNFVSWNWKAGGAPVTNNAGSISAQVSANPSAGFSIVTYTGTGANATVGHGLGVAPKMVITKVRGNAGYSWTVGHASSGWTNYLYLNTTAASAAAADRWQNTAPTSSVFSVGVDGAVNGSTQTLVAYCFAEIPGFSKIGSYTGNGSADGPFVHCGFRPRYVMVKRTDSATGGDWYIKDTARSVHNVMTEKVLANSSQAEDTGAVDIDITSNGFKVRSNTPNSNANGGTYIFIAFAEAPFQSALAR